MACLRENLKDDSDIGPPKEYFVLMGIITAIVLAVVAALNVAAILDTASYNGTKLPYENARIEEFNALPLEGRKAIIEYNQIEDFEPVTYQRPLLGERRASVWVIDYPDVTIRVAVIAFSAITFLLYAACTCNMNFYLCDVPRTWFGRLLFWIMFVGWPFLVISWVRMHIIEHENLRVRRERWKKEAADRNGLQEAATEQDLEAPAKIAQTALATEGLAEGSEAEPDEAEELPDPIVRPPLVRQPEHAAEEAYAEFAKMSGVTGVQRKLKVTSADIVTTEIALADLGKSMQVKQRELGELKAKQSKLMALQAELQQNMTEGDFAKKVRADWQIVRQLQGVYEVTLDSDKLVVLVRVCVPYDDDYYDFGDFRITMDTKDGYCCEEIRSGRLPDGGDWYINEDDTFCFGDRSEVIAQYMEVGRYIEALALMIDCLHSVNDEDWECVPEGFYKIDVTADPVVGQYYAVMGGGD